MDDITTETEKIQIRNAVSEKSTKQLFVAKYLHESIRYSHTITVGLRQW